MHRFFWLFLAALISVPLFVGPAAARRIPCGDVLHEMNYLRSVGSNRATKAEYLARRLDTSPLWIEKCAAMYGRQLDQAPMDSDARLRQEERWEAEEPEEVSREELEARGDGMARDLHNEDRTRQRQMNQSAQNWEPTEHRPWEPNLGHIWSPYLYDLQREPRVKVPGLNTQ